MNPVKALVKYKVILNNNEDISYDTVTKALKLIFNLTESEAGEKAIEAHSRGSTVLEIIHKEKLELRDSQVRAWNEHNDCQLPITFVTLQGK